MWADGSNNVITCCRCYHKRYVFFIYFNQASIYKNKIAISYKFLFIRLATDKCRYLFSLSPFPSLPPHSPLYYFLSTYPLALYIFPCPSLSYRVAVRELNRRNLLARCSACILVHPRASVRCTYRFIVVFRRAALNHFVQPSNNWKCINAA